ncbi:dihydrofolate reductase family protein [Asanoa sp. WMMD1127]|uniref:dihydrofolate reductase family protein n=1 Tax=Asanoa sp. WMMD1127 TaxID=3016107 RepID=UPI0024172A5D|nr:dihydrofolate reductase family protein [Asanoa sp. WMMD1127]MDG4820795.1 dihydrofolate reductase family protein [Asanoa sp. WMMD1127]
MRLTTITNVSLDGVTQGHREIAGESYGGFHRFGWGPPLLDDEASRFISKTFLRADAFLLGRRTYDIFAGSWGAGMDPGNPVGSALNTRPKYVVSSSLTDPRWTSTTVLSGDVTAAVEELRAAPGGELQVWGSGTLIRWLLERRLVDQLVLLTYPVVVGEGVRLFPTTGPDIGLELVDLRSTPKGLAIGTYRTTGRPRYEPSGQPGDEQTQRQ